MRTRFWTRWKQPLPGAADPKQDMGAVQVIDKDADAVLDEVEAAIYSVALQILKGDGFSFDIPSRSKGNQLYVPELDRIVLKDSMSQRPFASTATCRKAVITARILQLVHELCIKRIHVTKRDLFYTDVKLFEVGLPVG
jgi:meiotic recombination protein SPO11